MEPEKPAQDKGNRPLKIRCTAAAPAGGWDEKNPAESKITSRTGLSGCGFRRRGMLRGSAASRGTYLVCRAVMTRARNKGRSDYIPSGAANRRSCHYSGLKLSPRSGKDHSTVWYVSLPLRFPRLVIRSALGSPANHTHDGAAFSGKVRESHG
jgi:hypothetical protein